jgi:urease accessory protein
MRPLRPQKTPRHALPDHLHPIPAAGFAQRATLAHVLLKIIHSTAMKNARHVFLAAFLALPTLVQAHPGHDGDHELIWDFNGGFLHPLTGWDHLLAMLAIGLLAAQLGGRARWLVPAAFIAAMTGGAALAHSALPIPAIEHVIAASLLILGLLLAFTVRLPVVVATALAALLALFHGAAHGAEMSVHSDALSYGLGFVTTTALLHAAGYALGHAFAKQSALARTLGATIAVAGVAAFAL